MNAAKSGKSNSSNTKQKIDDRIHIVPNRKVEIRAKDGTLVARGYEHIKEGPDGSFYVWFSGKQIMTWNLQELPRSSDESSSCLAGFRTHYRCKDGAAFAVVSRLSFPSGVKWRAPADGLMANGNPILK